MSRILSYNLFEASIGSENIRKKWYPKIPKKLFYTIINLDPTSVRKKDFSKPGKFSKWLIMKMVDRTYNDLTSDGKYFLESEKEKLNFYLFIFSTNWYKLKTNGIKDIFKFKSLNHFMNEMQKFEQNYLLNTDAKYDIIYHDDNIDIVVPLNYSASWETAKNTDWCTKNIQAWKHWSSIAILFRILPKSKNYNKLKLTFTLTEPYNWTLASQKYPELYGKGNPFEKTKSAENWQNLLTQKLQYSEVTAKTMYDIWKRQGYSDEDIPKSDFSTYKEIEKTMSIVSDEAKRKIEETINKYKK